MAAKASSQICCNSSKLEEHTGSAKGFVVAGEWEEEEHLLPAPHFRLISCSEQIQPQQSPNSGNKRLAQQVQVGNIFPDTQMFGAGGTLFLGASIEATVETKEDSSHLNPPHNYLLSLNISSHLINRSLWTYFSHISY